MGNQVQLQAREDLVATAAYQPEPLAVAAARKFVRETLRSWPLAGRPARRDTLIDDAVLLTSELVTNAVVHAGTSVYVTCKLLGGALEIVVLDERPAQIIPDRPQAVADPAERTSGRGLQLPSELASAWGVTYARAVKAVWFRLSLRGLGGEARAGGSAGSGPGEAEIGPDGSARRAGQERAGLAAALAEAGLATGQDGFGAHPPVAPHGGPAWARRNLTRLGYEELLSSTAEAGRAAVAADIGYVLDAGEDGELRVRAVAGAGLPWLAPGSVTWSAARALAGAALSLVTVPLIVDGKVTGVLTVAAAEPGRFGEHDAVRLQELADQTAPALERARLEELEHGRQDRAEFLAAAGEELSSTLNLAEIAAIGARLGVGSLASWCAILAVADDGRLRLLNAAHTDAAQAEGLDWLLQHAGPPAGQPADWRARRVTGWRWNLELAAPRQAQEQGQATGPAQAPPGVPELIADQAWCFPLAIPGRLLGLLAIGAPGGQWPAREARELAAGLARRIAVAMDNAAHHARQQASTAGRAPASQAAGRTSPSQAAGRRAKANQAPAD
jgi:GAF domain-containing protein/anti-sigma regulatory factor (Ser/Thr protein kinase)